jgi:transposase-like protein
MERFNPIEEVFKGRHFDGQIIILCVAWYTSFELSLRDLVIMMGDRGIPVTHTTILRWVQRYLPEFEKRAGGASSVHRWIVEDGRDVYKGSRTMGVPVPRRRQSESDSGFLSQPEPRRERRQIVSAQRSEEHSRAYENHIGRVCASHRAVREMREDGELPCRVKVRSSQYLNNLVEQDHRRVKQRVRPMLGFNRFDNAVVTISGIELAEKIKKGQFKTGKLGGRNATSTELWNAALAA